MRRTGRIRHCGRAALFAAALLLAVPSAIAQTSPVAEIARYEGADREQRLIEGAKREKELTLYSSIPPEDIAVLATAFDKKYGVKVKVWRADSESLLQRITDEAKARRYEVDIVAGSSSALEPLYRENLLQEVRSPLFRRHHRRRRSRRTGNGRRSFSTPSSRPTIPIWCATRDCPRPLRTCSRRSGRASSGSRPRTTIGSRRWSPTSARRAGCGCFATSWPRTACRCARATTPSPIWWPAARCPWRSPSTAFSAEQAKRKGAALDWFVIPPAIARPTSQGLARNAPHPHAAVLFFDFLIGEGQQILASRQFVTVSRKIESPFNRSPLQLIDSTMMLDHARKWQELFQKTIVGPSR